MKVMQCSDLRAKDWDYARILFFCPSFEPSESF